MSPENAHIYSHIHQTIDTITRLNVGEDPVVKKHFCRAIGDQYEAMIAFSVSELRTIADEKIAHSIW
jgi:hypothetical protein